MTAMIDAVKTCFQKYVDFNGSAARPELWYFFLFTFVVSIVLGAFSLMLANIFSLLVLLPSLAVGARRLHDIGKSGWWQLLYLVPLVGLIVLIYWFAQPKK